MAGSALCFVCVFCHVLLVVTSVVKEVSVHHKKDIVNVPIFLNVKRIIYKINTEQIVSY